MVILHIYALHGMVDMFWWRHLSVLLKITPFGPIGPEIIVGSSLNSLYWFARASIIKYHMQNDFIFSQFWEARSPKSTCWQGWFLLRLLPLACRWPPSCHVFTWFFPLCMHIPGGSLCLSRFSLIIRTPAKLY